MTYPPSELDQHGLTQSLWAATAGPAQDYPPLKGDVRTDVVIVGAGFAGLSSALHLAERGVDVVVLEAMEPGFGASGRNGGQVISGLKDGLEPMLRVRFGAEATERLYDFADRTADTVFDLIERHEIDCDASRRGWIQGAHSSAAAERMKSKAENRARRGHDVAYLDATESARLTGSNWYRGGFLDRRGGQLQPLKYARGLAGAAAAAGCRIHAGTPATSVERKNDRWQITTPKGEVSAERVLLCTNGYSAMTDIVPSLSKSVVPFFSYQVATAPISDNLRRAILPEGHCVSDTRRLLGYYRFDAEGRFLMGARGRIDGSLRDDAFDLARRRLRELMPELAEQPLAYFWNGRVAVTPDYFPRVMELAPGLHAAVGWNGRGVAMTSAMGPVLADWLCGKPAGDLPMPVLPVRSIPFHGLRFFGAWAMARWMDWQDKRERART